MSWNRTASVTEENIEPMLREYMELRKAGSKQNSMIAALSKYWTGRKLESMAQVRNLVYRLTSSGKAPQFFVDYWNSQEIDAKSTADTTVPEVATESVAQETVAEITQSIVKGEEKSCEEWVSLLEEDNERLRGQIKELQSKVQNTKTPSAPTASSLNELFDLLARCVKFGIMNEADVVAKIRRALSSGV